jgi:choline dehydrogenase
MIFFAMNHGGVGVDQDMAQFGEAGIHVALFEAHSRGSVSLASTDPHDQPVVDLNMLDDERDLVRLRDGARRLMAIGSHDAVVSRCREVSLGNTGRPVADLATASDEAVDDWILGDCSDAQHGAGSCRMGAFDFDDGKSVVDPACRVRGIDGLRVVDASVMPADCKANTNFTTIMIGELMAERIRDARRRPG